jgi:hypothetical protein
MMLKPRPHWRAKWCLLLSGIGLYGCDLAPTAESAVAQVTVPPPVPDCAPVDTRWLDKDEFARRFPVGAAISSETLTYQTTRYGIGRAEVTVAYAFDSGQSARVHFDLREEGKDDWRIVDWQLGSAERL